MNKYKYGAVVMGASAGAVESLSAILPLLPENYPLPIIIVVHMPPDKKSVMAELLQNKCRIVVKEAEDKDKIEAGHAYIAPPDYHLLIEAEKYFALSYDEPQMFSRPSIDVLFETAADAYEDKLLGIVLSGANNDGAAGARMIEANGGDVLVQNPGDSYATAMPEAAIKLCANAKVMTLKQIANYLEEGIYI